MFPGTIRTLRVEKAPGKKPNFASRTKERGLHGRVAKDELDVGVARNSRVQSRKVLRAQRHLQSRRRCGRGAPSPGADVARVLPVPVQTLQG
jgi:hypothetical protein